MGEVFSRQRNGLWQHEFLNSDSKLEIPSAGFTLPLAVLYENLPAA